MKQTVQSTVVPKPFESVLLHPKRIYLLKICQSGLKIKLHVVYAKNALSPHSDLQGAKEHTCGDVPLTCPWLALPCRTVDG